MKRSKKSSSIAKIAAAVSLIAFQGIPETSFAQKPIRADKPRQNTNEKRNGVHIKFANSKLAEQKLTVVAFLNGEPVMKFGKNELYKMNTQTGDLKQVTQEEYNKLSFYEKTHSQNKIYASKERPVKAKDLIISFKCSENSYYSKNQIQLLGVDIDGHDIFQNVKKEKFYFDPATGDMVDFTGHIALIEGER